MQDVKDAGTIMDKNNASSVKSSFKYFINPKLFRPIVVYHLRAYSIYDTHIIVSSLFVQNW